MPTKSKKGIYLLAAFVVLAGLVFGYLVIKHVLVRTDYKMSCQYTAILLHVTAENNDKTIPEGGTWCDKLVEYDRPLALKAFATNETGDVEDVKTIFFLNENIAGKKWPQAEDVVVLCEGQMGFNKTGCADNAYLERHVGRGCFVAFSNLKVKFVAADNLPLLRWTTDAQQAKTQ